VWRSIESSMGMWCMGFGRRRYSRDSRWLRLPLVSGNRR
jgi:hypothetical protein